MPGFDHPKSSVELLIVPSLEFWLQWRVRQRYSWVLPRRSANNSISRLISATSIAIVTHSAKYVAIIALFAVNRSYSQKPGNDVPQTHYRVGTPI